MQEQDIKNPFTKEEQVVMAAIVTAYNTFVQLEQTHPSDIKDFTDAVHTIQRILSVRINRRDYPEIFQTIKKKED